jgi:predicted nucleotide-binding protein
MEKTKIYELTRFPPDVVRDAAIKLIQLYCSDKALPEYLLLKVQHADSEWSYDMFEEFLADYRIHQNDATLQLCVGDARLWLRVNRGCTLVNVRADTRANVETVSAIFEEAQDRCRIADQPSASTSVVIFVGHGRSQLWRDLKDHLQDKHGYTIEAYETGARSGHCIRDILEEMAAKSSFAILVMTAEDEQAGGVHRARQNVVHEAGLFQGRLGFARAIMLLEDGVEEFSNVQGVQHIRFARGNIKESYGEVLATLRREFGR